MIEEISKKFAPPAKSKPKEALSGIVREHLSQLLTENFNRDCLGPAVGMNLDHTVVFGAQRKLAGVNRNFHFLVVSAFNDGRGGYMQPVRMGGCEMALQSPTAAIVNGENCLARIALAEGAQREVRLVDSELRWIGLGLAPSAFNCPT